MNISLRSQRTLQCASCGKLLARSGDAILVTDAGGNAIPIRSSDPGGHSFRLGCLCGEDTVLKQTDDVAFEPLSTDIPGNFPRAVMLS